MSLIDYGVAVEAFDSFIDEALPLIEKNHIESGVYDLKFSPDLRRYAGLDNQGDAMVITLRKDMKLVGYSIYFLDEEIYQQGVFSATQSTLYIDPPHRQVAVTFIKKCDDLLKGLGVNSIWRQASVKKDIGVLYRRLGYKEVETSYLKEL